LNCVFFCLGPRRARKKKERRKEGRRGGRGGKETCIPLNLNILIEFRQAGQP